MRPALAAQTVSFCLVIFGLASVAEDGNIITYLSACSLRFNVSFTECIPYHSTAFYVLLLICVLLEVLFGGIVALLLARPLGKRQLLRHDVTKRARAGVNDPPRTQAANQHFYFSANIGRSIYFIGWVLASILSLGRLVYIPLRDTELGANSTYTAGLVLFSLTNILMWFRDLVELWACCAYFKASLEFPDGRKPFVNYFIWICFTVALIAQSLSAGLIMFSVYRSIPEGHGFLFFLAASLEGALTIGWKLKLTQDMWLKRLQPSHDPTLNAFTPGLEANDQNFPVGLEPYAFYYAKE
jgi:hypothetical protein